jgi:hypothetical protein
LPPIIPTMSRIISAAASRVRSSPLGKQWVSRYVYTEPP